MFLLFLGILSLRDPQNVRLRRSFYPYESLFGTLKIAKCSRLRRNLPLVSYLERWRWKNPAVGAAGENLANTIIIQ